LRAEKASTVAGGVNFQNTHRENFELRRILIGKEKKKSPIPCSDAEKVNTANLQAKIMDKGRLIESVKMESQQRDIDGGLLETLPTEADRVTKSVEAWGLCKLKRNKRSRKTGITI